MGLEPARRAFLPLAAVLAAAACGPSVVRDDLPIEDDFSGDECNWAETNDEHVSLSCEDGAFLVRYRRTDERIHHMIPRRMDGSVDKVAVTAAVALERAPGDPADSFQWHGVACWASGPREPARGYLFLVGPDAEAFVVLRMDETDESLADDLYMSALVDQESAAVVPRGRTNRIRGECRNDGELVQLRMTIDGDEVAAVVDDRRFGPYEGFGFATFSTVEGTEIRFDDFVAERID